MTSKTYESFYETVSSLESTIQETERSLADLSQYGRTILEQSQGEHFPEAISGDALGVSLSSRQYVPDIEREFSRFSRKFFGNLQSSLGGLFLDNERNIRSVLSDTLGKMTRNLSQGLLGNLLGFGGGAFPLSVNKFASGGVIDMPVVFPQAGGLGLAGEAGPEAILPLARGQDGRLGVTNITTGQKALNVKVVNVYDTRQIGEALASREGERVIINTISANADLLRRMLRI